MVDLVPDQPRKGRGAISNASSRYESLTRHAIDDGWNLPGDDLPPIRTLVTAERPKTIIARNASPDVPFDRSINPYRGCEHGCIYCFARPSHAHHGLSPGLDFESRLFYKRDAAALLEAEFRKPSYRCRMIQLGANTDPYQPIARNLGITRQILDVLSRFNHPVGITTKSSLVTRDIDILAPMAEHRLAFVGISLTTLERGLARRLEPRAPTPVQRLRAMEKLAAAGIPVIVMAAPIIPGLNDHELERILEAAAEAGACAANFLLLRLPLEIKKLFTEWLEAHAPDRAEHILTLIRQCRDGKLNQSQWGTRMRGTGEYAELISQRFRLACKRNRLAETRPTEFQFSTALFCPPPMSDDQLSLF